MPLACLIACTVVLNLRAMPPSVSPGATTYVRPDSSIGVGAFGLVVAAGSRLCGVFVGGCAGIEAPLLQFGMFRTSPGCRASGVLRGLAAPRSPGLILN